VDMACGSSVVFDWRQTTRTHLAMSIFYFQRLLRYAFAGRPLNNKVQIAETLYQEHSKRILGIVNEYDAGSIRK
ncbi:MAG: hypothetical protein ABSF52_12335, partial [Syntrophobacteraceae bacterium]